MLSTFIREMYRADEARSVADAFDELCSPRDTYGWASAGIYCYWDPETRVPLYIGLARDLAERFRQHNALQSCPADGCKRHQLNQWLASHSTVGLSIMVQSPMTQPNTHRSSALAVNPNSGAVDLFAAEGVLLEMHRQHFGTLPAWNSIGGSFNPKGAVKIDASDIWHLAVLTGVRDQERVARASLRELAADPTRTHYEADVLHAARMLCGIFDVMGRQRRSSALEQTVRQLSPAEGDSIVRWMSRPDPFRAEPP